MAKVKKTNDGFEKLITEELISEGKVPPHSRDLEMNVIGGLLYNNELIDSVMTILDPSLNQFYVNAHNLIYNAICDLQKRNEPADLVTLAEELKNREELDKIGGTAALVDITSSIATLNSIVYSATKIREYWVKRKLIKLTYTIRESSFEAGTNTEDLLDRTQQDVLEITNFLQRKDYIKLSDEIRTTISVMEDIHEKFKKGTMTFGVPTGYKDLDALTGGFQKAELVIIAGRPSHGKSAFALNIARNAAVEHKKNIGIFSLEMSNTELALRFICLESKVNISDLKSGKLGQDGWDKIAKYSPKFLSNKTNIFIDDSSPMTLLELRAKARRMKNIHNIDLIIVDYLQLMDIGNEHRVENRHLEIGIITRSLKQLSKELSIPVIALSQLSRKLEDRSGSEKKPQLSDLRESGSIEQDADVVIFISRPELFLKHVDQDDKDYDKTERQKAKLSGLAEIIIGKQRNGPIGKVDLHFEKEYAKFAPRVKFEPDSPQYYLPEEEAPF